MKRAKEKINKLEEQARPKLSKEKIKEAEEDLKKFYALPPYNEAMNPCAFDGIFAHSIIEKYGMGFCDLLKVTNINPRRRKK